MHEPNAMNRDVMIRFAALLLVKVRISDLK
jgi:hypothetical protein